MTDNVIERKKDEGGKAEFLLTGFTQAAGIRIYAFEGRIEARRIDYKVEVNLALIPVYGIRIQDLPLLCRELLQHREQPDEVHSVVFTEQDMRTHADKLSAARESAESRKRQPRHLVRADTGNAWRTPYGPA